MLKLLKKFAIKYLRRRNRLNARRILQLGAMTGICNVKPTHISSIVFVLPNDNVSAFGGGSTSIFRIANGLFNMGLDVYVTTAGGDHIREINCSVNKLFNGLFQPKIVACNCLDEHKFDIIIATSWQTAYYIRRYEGYKMYFVQDYEPYFAVRGDMFYLADKSYGMGLHMISLGAWNKKMILERYPNAVVDEVGFPFDSKNYIPIARESIDKKTVIKAAVYLRNTPRRLPYITEWVCENLVKLFAADGKQLQVYYFGDDMREKVNSGKNIGAIGWSELISLYRECDFGIVFSYTNISLVPYEMMATGLPIVELKEGTFTYFMPEESAILFDGDIAKLYKSLLFRLTNIDVLNHVNMENYKLLSLCTWENTIYDFYNIISKV